jgi:protein-disulfide isomerase
MHDKHRGEITLQRLLLLAAAVAVATVGWFLLGESEPVIAEEMAAESGGKVLAKINGKPLTEAEVLKDAKGQLLKIERDRHELVSQMVKQQVQDMLIQQEADKRKLSKEELLQQEIQGKVDEVAQEKVDEFYTARKIRAPKEEIEPKIREYLRSEAFNKSLQDKAKVEYFMEPFRVDVAATGPAKGPAKAPITIIEFSDFQCPYCSRVGPALKQVTDKYGDKVKVVFRQYPLPMHAEAPKAGEASLCANDQGKFWEMHDAMFADQQGLGIAKLKEKAAALGIDTAAFDECLDSGHHAETVEMDMAAGSDAGVSGTPAFFINGRFVNGAAAFETFDEIISEELGSAD